jgi:NCAIR mutase (PurE)-related protein
VSVDAGLEGLKHFPYEALPFATIDHHRELRQGFPEVVLCEGKTDAQVLAILQAMEAGQAMEVGSDGGGVLATRVAPTLARKIQKKFKGADYNRIGRVVAIRLGTVVVRAGRIVLMTAGTSDLPVAEEARATATFLGYTVVVLYDVGVAGLHRLLGQMDQIEGADVVIVVAGMDGALPSIVGGITGRPVLAVPTSRGYGVAFGGVSALMTMLNSCAAGLAVVNIDNGFGAAMLAHRILNGGGE